MSREAIEGRRQRAFEVAEDMIMGGDRPSAAVREAIETATRVKITDEAIDAYYLAGVNGPDVRGGLAAALAELGFEVEE